MLNNLKQRAITILLSLAMIITYMPMSMMTAYAAAGDVPAHDKILHVNGDGTYKLALSVTGDAEKKPIRTNVIVILDNSNSMDRNSGNTEVTYTPINDNGNPRYGLINGEYVQLTRWNRRYYYNGTEYTGQRYIRTEANQTRMEAAQDAVNSLAETLLGYNGVDGNPTDTFEMALIRFGTTASVVRTPTTSYSQFENAVNGIEGNGGGTNWEHSFQTVSNVNFNDQDPTYVIFVTDGSPTFHSSDGGYGNWNNTYRVYGSGQEEEPNMERSYTQALDDATSVANTIGADHFYTIFAYGTTVGANYLSDLTTGAGAPAGNNYSAENTTAL